MVTSQEIQKFASYATNPLTRVWSWTPLGHSPRPQLNPNVCYSPKPRVSG